MSEFETMELELAVDCGMAWLDQVYPEWIDVIDEDNLHMDCEFGCAAGQVLSFTHQYEGKSKFLGLKHWITTTTSGYVWLTDNFGEPWVVAHGFDLPSKPDATVDWDDLRDIWVCKIKERRLSDALPQWQDEVLVSL